MQVIFGKNKLGRQIVARFRIEPNTLMELQDCYSGLCLQCGDVTDSGVEPDARRYACQSCSLPGVYGVDELLLMGRIEVL